MVIIAESLYCDDLNFYIKKTVTVVTINQNNKRLVI